MARQLKPEEKIHFAKALQNADSIGNGESTFQQSLDARREGGLQLSPELEAWFGKEFLPWLNS